MRRLPAKILSAVAVFSLVTTACNVSHASELRAAEPVADGKEVIQNFFETLSAGNYDQAFTVVSDEVVWWVPGNLPFSGNKTKAQYMGIVQRIRSGFPNGFTLTVTGMIAEGDKIAAEVESNGVHLNGRTYNNHYHFLFQLRDGQIIAVKEYMDTLHLAQLIAP